MNVSSRVLLKSHALVLNASRRLWCCSFISFLTTTSPSQKSGADMQAAVFMPPTTPRRSPYESSTSYSHPPLHSSPLASPASSPAASAQARRRMGYKANPFNTPRARDTHTPETRRRTTPTANTFVQGSSSEGAPATEEPPRKTFLRERLKARCLERAAKKRERAVARGSHHLSSDRSSDGLDEMMDEDDEEEDSMLNDEVRMLPPLPRHRPTAHHPSPIIAAAACGDDVC